MKQPRAEFLALSWYPSGPRFVVAEWYVPDEPPVYRATIELDGTGGVSHGDWVTRAGDPPVPELVSIQLARWLADHSN
jgi:hypothetical protein